MGRVVEAARSTKNRAPDLLGAVLHAATTLDQLAEVGLIDRGGSLHLSAAVQDAVLPVARLVDSSLCLAL